MAGLAVLRRASGLSDAYRPRWQRQVFEQAVLGPPACSVRCRTLVLAAGGNQRVMLLSIFRNSSRNDHERHQESGRAVRNDGFDRARRRWLKTLAASAAAAVPVVPVVLEARGSTMASEVFTVYTFRDSILDCARYNEYGVHPGQLIVRNDDGLFPDFKGRDLSSSAPARLDRPGWGHGR